MLHECALLVPHVPVSVKFLIKYNCMGLGVGLGVVCYLRSQVSSSAY